MYDNLPVEAIGAFRTLSAEHAQVLLEKMDQWLSKHDRDVKSIGGGHRAHACRNRYLLF